MADPEHAQKKERRTERKEKSWSKELREHVNATASGSRTKKKQLLIDEHLNTARRVHLNCPSVR